VSSVIYSVHSKIMVRVFIIYSIVDMISSHGDDANVETFCHGIGWDGVTGVTICREFTGKK
jgi:hypothetical protein